ncbi:hypothetical protein AB0P21_09890 [Kribbella sp. NPDC056861]|uniref:hypothetical protein n=1 Tax=Kribbella sp. NPDC056861 TaxID=3154857 RepID=UPI0034358B95
MVHLEICGLAIAAEGDRVPDLLDLGLVAAPERHPDLFAGLAHLALDRGDVLEEVD